MAIGVQFQIQIDDLQDENSRLSQHSCWVDNIKGDRRERGCNCVNWLKLKIEVPRAIRNTITRPLWHDAVYFGRYATIVGRNLLPPLSPSTLKMEGTGSFETLLPTCLNKLRYFSQRT
jgi:hypothetical protein